MFENENAKMILYCTGVKIDIWGAKKVCIRACWSQVGEHLVLYSHSLCKVGHEEVFERSSWRETLQFANFLHNRDRLPLGLL